MIVDPVTGGQAFFLQLLMAFGVHLNKLVAVSGERLVAEYAAHVVEQTQGGKQRGDSLRCVAVCQHLLGAGVALCGRLLQPEMAKVRVLFHLLAQTLKYTAPGHCPAGRPRSFC